MMTKNRIEITKNNHIYPDDFFNKWKEEKEHKQKHDAC